MTKLNLKFHNDLFSDALLNKSVSEILEQNTLMSMATVKENRSFCKPEGFTRGVLSNLKRFSPI